MANEDLDDCTDSPHKDGTILDGAKGGVGEDGVATFTVRYMATTSKSLLAVGAFTFLGLSPASRTWEALNDGTSGFIVTVTYKGHLDGQEPDANSDDVFSEKWGMDFDYSEEPLETHPRIQEIVKKYGGLKIAAPNKGYDFPLAMPAGTKRTASLSARTLNSSGEVEKNPVYGMTTYPLLQAVVTRSFSCKKLPAEIVRNAGKSTVKIPGAPSDFDDLTPSDRNWMQMAPKITPEGAIWRVDQSWKLSPPGGWVEIVHDVIDS